MFRGLFAGSRSINVTDIWSKPKPFVSLLHNYGHQLQIYDGFLVLQAESSVLLRKL